ncbi:MAG: helix-turn-helix transcriptional regulator [Bryobacteraceae bacterium]|jgi:transcriptional regulator with XRE-family HTH domain
MEKNQQQNQNSLFIFRRRMGFSQKHVARLLGFRHTCMVSRYEHGRSLPPLKTALSLGIILRVPVEFLFPGLYDSMRESIRAAEERMARPVQPTLFSVRH